MHETIQISITLKKETFKKLEVSRGKVPRSVSINDRIEKSFDNKKSGCNSGKETTAKKSQKRLNLRYSR